MTLTQTAAVRTLALFAIVVLVAACNNQNNGANNSDTGLDVDGGAGDSGTDDVASDASDAAPETDEDVAGETEDDASDVTTDGSGTDILDDTSPEPEPTYGTLDAIASCPTLSDACVETSINSETFASYRKDSYFLDEVYNEYTDYPVDGGRIHIAGVATRSGAVTDVSIDGVSVTARLAAPNPSLDWYHVWPDPLVEGEPVWVAFHSRDPAWDTTESGTVVVATADGSALDATFPVQTTSAPLTYVTTSDDRTRVLVHIRNHGDVPTTLESLRLNGREVLENGIACDASATIEPGRAALIEVPLCTPLELGSAWTVVAEYNNTTPAVGVGRVLRPFFPIEAWPSGGDCARADGAGGTENFRAHIEAGFDTMYYYWGGGGDGCGATTQELVNSILPALEDPMYVLVGDDFLNFPDPETLITDTSRVAGFLTGDESDGTYLLDDGSPAPENKARKARRLWSMYPDLPVYNGGKTNGHVGAFAGMTDIQGMDLYVAACAPHITYDPQHPPLRGAYDYLRNTRENHMPLPTWLYAQGLHSGWNREVGDTVVRRQPDRGEVWVQLISVIAAGGKGLMWFQTDLDEAAAVPESWDAIAEGNRIFAALRRVLREGDITGHATADGEVIVEAIRSSEAMVVPVVNLAHSFAPTDLLCIQSIFDSSLIPHWALSEQRVDVDVVVPEDLALSDVVEIGLDGTVTDAAYSVDEATRVVRIHRVVLSQERPAAVYVLLADPELREELEAALGE
jgi:hypothetical protein